MCRSHRKFSPLVNKEERKGNSYFSYVYCSHDDEDLVKQCVDKIKQDFTHIAQIINITAPNDVYHRVGNYFPEYVHYLPPLSSYPSIKDWDKAEYNAIGAKFEKSPSLRLAGNYAFYWFLETVTSDANNTKLAWSTYLQNIKKQHPFYAPIYLIHPMDRELIQKWGNYWNELTK